MISFLLVITLKLNQLIRHILHLNKSIFPGRLIRANFSYGKQLFCETSCYQTLSCQNHLCCSSRSWSVLILTTLPFLNCEFFSFFILLILHEIINCYIVFKTTEIPCVTSFASYISDLIIIIVCGSVCYWDIIFLVTFNKH